MLLLRPICRLTFRGSNLLYCAGWSLHSQPCVRHEIHGQPPISGTGESTVYQHRRSSSSSDFTPNLTPGRERRWTPEEDNLATSMKEQGLPLDHIAATLERSKSSVRQRLERRKAPRIPPRVWQQDEVDALLRMHNQGTPMEEICRELHRSKKV